MPAAPLSRNHSTERIDRLELDGSSIVLAREAAAGTRTTTDATIVDAANTYASLLLDRQALLANAHVFDATELRVRTHPAQAIAIDGEQCGKTPATFKVVPGALRVMVPAVTPPAVP